MQDSSTETSYLHSEGTTAGTQHGTPSADNAESNDDGRGLVSDHSARNESHVESPRLDPSMNEPLMPLERHVHGKSLAKAEDQDSYSSAHLVSVGTHDSESIEIDGMGLSTESRLRDENEPQMQSGTLGSDAVVETIEEPKQDVEHEKSPEDREWEEWLSAHKSDTGPSPDKDLHEKNLEAYVQANAKRKTAKRRLETALEECLDGITKAMTEEMLADSVGVAYTEQAERFEGLEATLVKAMQSNHVRRGRMLDQLDTANQTWESQYKRMRYSVVNENHGGDAETPRGRQEETLARESSSREGKQDAEATTVPKDNEGGSNAVEEAAEDKEPDWDRIVSEYPPADPSVRTFLAAREKLRTAEENLSHAMDEIHGGLKADAEAMTQAAIDFYNQKEEESVALEHSIQHLLMSNDQRRRDFEDTLRESSKQAQGLLTNLLSRLSGPAM